VISDSTNLLLNFQFELETWTITNLLWYYLWKSVIISVLHKQIRFIRVLNEVQRPSKN